MNKSILIYGLILLSLLFCHKRSYIGSGLIEIKNFEWQLDSDNNRLYIKYYLQDVPVDTIISTVVQVTVKGVTIENHFEDPTVVLDVDENSARKGEQCIEEEWVPVVTLSNESLQHVKLFIRQK